VVGFGLVLVGGGLARLGGIGPGGGAGTEWGRPGSVWLANCHNKVHHQHSTHLVYSAAHYRQLIMAAPLYVTDSGQLWHGQSRSPRPGSDSPA
jgi:hypothetical protein